MHKHAFQYPIQQNGILNSGSEPEMHNASQQPQSNCLINNFLANQNSKILNNYSNHQNEDEDETNGLNGMNGLNSINRTNCSSPASSSHSSENSFSFNF